MKLFKAFPNKKPDLMAKNNTNRSDKKMNSKKLQQPFVKTESTDNKSAKNKTNSENNRNKVKYTEILKILCKLFYFEMKIKS